MRIHRPIGRSGFRWGVFSFSVALALLAATACARAAPLIHLLEWEGPIGPITAEYLAAELADAALADADLVILQLDTPGGLDSSMRVMIQDMLASPVPVAVYVAPAGARAASAGAFLLVAAHIAAMSPATNVGAAHPVNMGGKLDETMAAKVTNDAVAYIRGLADRRGRNSDWCEQAVRESVSAAADSALTLGVIDFVVADIPALLDAAHGREVGIDGGDETRTIDSIGGVIVIREPTWRQKFLRRITDPNVAYIFMMLGIYGLFFELSRPGAVVPGVVGAISLLLALLAFQSLPVNYVGVLLILVGMVLLLLEIKITSYGTLALGGVVSLLLGSLLLFENAGPVGALSLKVVLPVVLVSAGFFLLLVGLGVRAQRLARFSGLDAMVGEEGTVAKVETGPDEGFAGMVSVFGELWRGHSDHALQLGDRVVVTACDGRSVAVVGKSHTPEPRGGS